MLTKDEVYEEHYRGSVEVDVKVSNINTYMKG